ncbi:unnamed protein product [Darwinula stevensoni]|uniref:SLC26A/SulP transporter domain-containing protein n=1 Tax=Darwinula stevensoni TaxID=69355 RepID=A0A7R8XM52_9CRUS|nr:unnamed protein product [Darwinula stevensoni]CAG0895126.1 unnamed protein product [Darwinula stevensoni]
MKIDPVGSFRKRLAPFQFVFELDSPMSKVNSDESVRILIQSRLYPRIRIRAVTPVIKMILCMWIPSDVLDRDASGSILVEDYSEDSRPCCPWPPNRQGIRKGIQKRIPITKWLPQYNLKYLVCDIIAGLTVGLTILPQGLAYAKIANLPVQYGLYSGFIGCFVYLFFGSVKDVTVGPTAIICLVLGQFVNSHAFGDQYVEYAILLCFLTGIVELILGITRLAYLKRLLPLLASSSLQYFQPDRERLGGKVPGRGAEYLRKYNLNRNLP